MVKRIHLTGASGSGTTTLGRALAERLGVPHFDTDGYFWLPTEPLFQEQREVLERIAMLSTDLDRRDGWVLSGSLMGWGDVFIPSFDLVVFLSVPSAVRLARLRERERQRYGAKIEPGGTQHEGHTAFMDWAAGYDDGNFTGRSRQRHEQWLAGLPCSVVRLEGEESVEERLAQLVSYIERDQALPR
jgi:adenylate kinase family enzyme